MVANSIATRDEAGLPSVLAFELRSINCCLTSWGTDHVLPGGALVGMGGGGLALGGTGGDAFCGAGGGTGSPGGGPGGIGGGALGGVGGASAAADPVEEDAVNAPGKPKSIPLRDSILQMHEGGIVRAHHKAREDA